MRHRISRISRRLVAALLGGVLVVFLTSCDEEVTAVVGTDRPFSLYGVVTPQLDSQWVRVFPVEGVLQPEPGDRLDAHFFSTDLDTGEEYLWRDSVIQDVFDQWAHVFWAPFQAEYGHTYLLQVRQDDGDETSVQVTVPPRTEVVLQTPQTGVTTVLLPIMIEGQAPRLLRIEVVYTVSYVRAGGAQLEADAVSIPYDGTQELTAEGWRIPVRPSTDFNTVMEALIRRIDHPIDRNIGITLLNMTLRLIVANEEWNPPDGMFDPERLVQPETMTNVQNGFGFVGAGYRHEFAWLPEPDVIRAAGFRTQEE